MIFSLPEGRRFPTWYPNETGLVTSRPLHTEVQPAPTPIRPAAPKIAPVASPSPASVGVATGTGVLVAGAILVLVWWVLR